LGKLESVNSQKNDLTISAMEEGKMKTARSRQLCATKKSAGRKQEFIILIMYSNNRNKKE
jgi:hypothetical protein